MDHLDDSYLVDDGQIVGTGHTEPTRPASPPDQSLAIPDINKKLNGFSKSASECLCKTHRLALELNHGTVSAAHLILAMTLIPNATAQFELRKVDINKAFQAAMMALTEMERGSPGRVGARSSSEELNKIINLALEFARNRDNQEVSVDDLLTALDKLPPEASAAELIRGGRKLDPAYDVREPLQRLSDEVGQQFQTVLQNVQDVAQMLRFSSVETTLSRELADIKSSLQSQYSDLQTSIASELAAIKEQLQLLKAPAHDHESNGQGAPTPDNDRNLEPKWLGGIFGNGKA